MVVKSVEDADEAVGRTTRHEDVLLHRDDLVTVLDAPVAAGLFLDLR